MLNTVGTNRVLSGTVDRLQYLTTDYDAEGNWQDVDNSRIYFQNTGLDTEIQPYGMGCNYINSSIDPDITDAEEAEIALCDISTNYPAAPNGVRTKRGQT